MKQFLPLTLCCLIFAGCSSSNSPTTESIDGGTPSELIGIWELACSGEESSGYQIQTLDFTDTRLTYTSQRYIDDNCLTEDVDNPGSSSSGAVTFGDNITTTNGVEAREFDHLNDTFNSEPLDPIVISYNIYLIQGGVLYIGGGSAVEADSPDTLNFDSGYLKQ
ncbi:hypothetical protein N9850_14520 [Granulosicoccus sp.]|nr:hypothetical protein [Granulosicoccus sp.]MDB4224976.1 hypothetical protein [Granulosicoccus sp.]